jgi:hypothetical protein
VLTRLQVCGKTKIDNFFLKIFQKNFFQLKGGMVSKIPKTRVSIFFTRGVALEDKFWKND